MQTEDLHKLVDKIQRLQCEMQTVELKSANKGCPTRLYDTLSSFANQDEGGIIIFGLDETKDFAVVGVYDAQDLQKKVTEQCNQMSPQVRALFTVCEFGDKLVVSAEIPGLDVAERPCFYRGAGRLRGAYIRVGDADEPMSEYEVYSYDAFRKRIRDDIREAQGARRSFFNEDKLAQFFQAVKKDRKHLAQHVSDEEILELMGITVNGQPTLAGELCFSKYPQGAFPQLCVTAVALPGTQMGEPGLQGERFIDNERITGTIDEMVDEAVDFVNRNSRHSTIIDAKGRRTDRDEYPLKAVREAVLNALVHRDYSIHSENVPVRLELYRDRLEIISSGGLYGKLTIDSLGKVRPDTRNSALANILELMRITENRYSGIPTIYHELKIAQLPPPVFSVRRGEFVVTFTSRVAQMYDVPQTMPTVVYEEQAVYAAETLTTEEKLLQFCSVPRSRQELIDFLGFSRYYTMSKLVQPLLDAQKLALTLPEKPKSSKQRYFKP
ncbi:ATP-binding protein [uncultured Phascolarctobacterium sp.]|uniref:ATP-binding protein n=1 Tax=uncultured Phascolarctobacterium sp. TaxID=512296 RepID=UPI0026003B1C|nr:ATP-binding protein [uncultured Phascolarctobacterium sp.]